MVRWPVVLFVFTLLLGMAGCQSVKADGFGMLVLKNTARGTYDTAICDVTPQEFTIFEDDGTYLYGSSKKNLSHGATDPAWNNLPCGVRYNKRKPADVGLILDARHTVQIGNEMIFFLEPVGPLPEIDLKHKQ